MGLRSRLSSKADTAAYTSRAGRVLALQTVRFLSRLKSNFRPWLRTTWTHPLRRRTIIASCIAVAFGTSVSGALIHAKRHTAAWLRVYSKGEYVGLAPDSAHIEHTMRTLAASYNLPLSFDVVHQSVPRNYSWRRVVALPVRAVAITANGRSLVYTSNQQAAETVLREVKQQLTPKTLPKGAKVSFSTPVSIHKALVGVAQVLSPAAALAVLLQPPQGRLSGRSSGPLAQYAELLPKHVSDVRPAAPKPLLQVVTTATVTRTVTTPYIVHYQNDSHLGTGSIKVLRSGKRGRASEQVKLEYVDGHLAQQQVVKKTVLKRPVTEYAERGTNSGIESGPWSWPVSNFVITSPFGWRYLFGGYQFHPGVDLACPTGTPIYATNAGVVESAGWNSGGYGNWVEINNGNGIQTIFGHMSRVAAHAGEVVYRGELIGYVGMTGIATGPHVHYEVRVNGTPVDPLPHYV